MSYLIDGYNLAHAMNLLPVTIGRQGLENARRHLLDHIARSPLHQAIRVVFDARSPSARRAPNRQTHKGIVVLFAQGSADDLIEDIIAHEGSPRELIVVSDDNRLRLAAHHRRCIVLGCLDFLEKIILLERASPAPAPPAVPEEEKPTALSAEDQKLLQELSALDGDTLDR